MSYLQLIDNIKTSISTPPTNSALIDLSNHASLFSLAVHTYVSALIDPAQRVVMTAAQPVMMALINALPQLPIPIASVAAQIAATQYQLAFTSYTQTIVIDPSSILLPIGGIVVPPGNIITAKLNDLGIGSSIYSDFLEIFLEELPPIPNEMLAIYKATKMATAIQKAYTTLTLVSISGVDSNPLPPIPFSISGPLVGF